MLPSYTVHLLNILLHTYRTMAKSFLPTIFEHPYEIDPKYGKSVAYFCMEYAIDNSFKIYSGGLGYLAGSHMRSAHDLRQNLVGVGILWSYGYYNQIRAEDGSMATQYMRKNYPFLEDHNIKFLIHVCGAPVWVKAYFLNPETFGTAPMFFLSTDLEENDEESRNISRRLYDANGFTRIAQYVLLGKGGARLFDELGIEPEIYHLNEAHGLAAAFHVLAKTGSVEEVRKRFVFTTHTPEEAGNEKMDVNTMNTFSFFNGQSNVALDNRITNIDMHGLGQNMRVFGMITALEMVRNRVMVTPPRPNYTWLYIDEVQSLFAHPTVVEYFARLWREGRKFGLICTGISQNTSHMLANAEARDMVLNSEFFLLHKQSTADLDAWAEMLQLSATERGYIGDAVKPGEGLLISAGIRVPITDDFPKGPLYDLWNTKPAEVAEREMRRAAREAEE